MFRSVLKTALAAVALVASLGSAANAGTVSIGLQQEGINGVLKLR
jgi:hypothetical protein